MVNKKLNKMPTMVIFPFFFVAAIFLIPYNQMIETPSKWLCVVLFLWTPASQDLWKWSVCCLFYLTCYHSLCVGWQLQSLCGNLGCPVTCTQQFVVMTCVSWHHKEWLHSQWFLSWNPVVSSFILHRFKANTIFRKILGLNFLFLVNWSFLIFRNFLLHLFSDFLVFTCWMPLFTLIKP